MVVRKGDGEASVGEHIGQPLSLAKIHIPGADVEEPACVEARCAGIGRSHV